MIKAIGFDMGGVIIRYTIPEQLEYISHELNVPIEKVRAAWAELRPLVDVGEIDNQEFWQRMLAQSGSGADPKTTEHLWSDNYISNNPFIGGMLKLVDKLRANGYKVGLLSNIDPEHGRINYGRHIFEHFDVALLSDEIHHRKPEREAFQMLADKLGVKFEEMVFIDDLLENVSAASSYGMVALPFDGYKRLLAELDRLGVKYQ